MSILKILKHARMRRNWLKDPERTREAARKHGYGYYGVPLTPAQFAVLRAAGPEVREVVGYIVQERERGHSASLSAMSRSRDDLRNTLKAALAVIERSEQVTARVSELVRDGFKVPNGVPHYRSTIAGTNGLVPSELFRAAFVGTFSENEKLKPPEEKVCEECRRPWRVVNMPIAGGSGCHVCGNRTYDVVTR